jgi:hypothetical protein
VGLRYGLSDADRERLGCPEWIEFDSAKITIRQLAEVERVTGMRPASFHQGLTEEQPSAEHLWVRMWLALRQAGVEIPLADFDFAVGSCRAEFVGEDAPGAPGKDPSTPPTRTPRSKRSSAATRSRSRT